MLKNKTHFFEFLFGKNYNNLRHVKLLKYLRLNTIKKTLFIGKNLLHFPMLASTNEHASLMLSKSKPPDGTVISTYNQHQGKGQSGSKWESEPDKNISITFILYPSFILARQQFLLNQAISLGVKDFTSMYINNGVKIKWSNDIYVNDNKIAGILIQNTLTGPNIHSSIVGIGININQSKFVSDAPNPTSLRLETLQNYSLDELTEILCWKIEIRYLQLRQNAFQQLKTDYLNCLYRYMEDALYQEPNGDVFQGRIIGIEDSGKLMLESKKGLRSYAMKEVKFII